MRRAALELVGAGKRSVLFEEAFGMTVVRTLRSAMEDHPFILASKTPLAARTEGPTWAARIEVLEATTRVRAGGRCTGRVRLTNVGRAAWEPAYPTGTGHVMLGIQLLDHSGRLVVRDHHRVTLPRPVLPAESLELSFDCPAPAEAGAAQLKFDLVAEGITWFEPTGSAAVVAPLQID
jgi:hypothetical protein